MATKSLTRGGGKANKPIVDQLKDLERQFADIKEAGAGRFAEDLIRSTSRDLYRDVVSSAQSAHIPHEAMKDIFYYARPRPGQKKISALVGLRKKGRSEPYAHGYVEWFAGKQTGKFEKTTRSRRSKKVLVIGGRKIGENLATMWELGTTKHSPRPFFRTAVEAGKARVIDSLTAGYQKILDEFATR